MNRVTRLHLEEALRGEVMAAFRYWLYQQQAEKEGLDDLAGIFDAIGTEERREHAREIAQLLEVAGATADNLRSAVAGEVDEHRCLYPGFAAAAMAVGDIRAAQLFVELGGDERRHADALRAELQRWAPSKPAPARLLHEVQW